MNMLIFCEMKPTNKLMKRLSLYLFLIFFTLPTSSQADDIRDFQIEGMSIGDSLLDYFSRDKILSEYIYPNKKFSSHFGTGENFKVYEGFQVFYLSNDDKYIIHYVAGINLYKNNKINKCYEKMYEIAEEIKSQLSFDHYDDSGKIENPFKKDTKNISHNLRFSFKDGDNITIACMDYHEDLVKDGYVDKLTVSVRSKEFVNFLSSGEAYR